MIWRWLSQWVDLQSAEELLINKDDDSCSCYVGVQTDVAGHRNDSTSDVRRTWRLGCHFKIDGRTTTIASANNLSERS